LVPQQGTHKEIPNFKFQTNTKSKIINFLDLPALECLSRGPYLGVKLGTAVPDARLRQVNLALRGYYLSERSGDPRMPLAGTQLPCASALLRQAPDLAGCNFTKQCPQVKENLTFLKKFVYFVISYLGRREFCG
jgi:hypothetical protein